VPGLCGDNACRHDSYALTTFSACAACGVMTSARCNVTPVTDEYAAINGACHYSRHLKTMPDVSRRRITSSPWQHRMARHRNAVFALSITACHYRPLDYLSFFCASCYLLYRRSDVAGPSRGLIIVGSMPPSGALASNI